MPKTCLRIIVHGHLDSDNFQGLVDKLETNVILTLA